MQQIQVYYHEIITKFFQEVFAWGCNEEGQLGIGSLEEKHTPTRVFRLHSGRFVKLASGYKHTIVCDNRGNVYTWGANGFG